MQKFIVIIHVLLFNFRNLWISISRQKSNCLGTFPNMVWSRICHQFPNISSTNSRTGTVADCCNSGNDHHQLHSFYLFNSNSRTLHNNITYCSEYYLLVIIMFVTITMNYDQILIIYRVDYQGPKSHKK